MKRQTRDKDYELEPRQSVAVGLVEVVLVLVAMRPMEQQDTDIRSGSGRVDTPALSIKSELLAISDTSGADVPPSSPPPCCNRSFPLH